MAKRELPSQELLRQLLRYEAGSGKLFWLSRGPEWFTDDERLTAAKKAAAWNGRNADREAFTASDGKGYLQGQVDGYHTTAHRVIWAWLNDEWPACLDHINGDGTDNRESNLRSVSHRENNRNMARPIGQGAVGVRYTKGSWEAYISTGGKQHYLGRFTSEDDAIAARKASEVEMGFHPNHGRDVLP